MGRHFVDAIELVITCSAANRQSGSDGNRYTLARTDLKEEVALAVAAKISDGYTDASELQYLMIDILMASLDSLEG